MGKTNVLTDVLVGFIIEVYGENSWETSKKRTQRTAFSAEEKGLYIPENS